MLTGLVLFLFYTAIFLFILYKLSLKKTFALSFKQAALAFIIKVAAGCCYGYFFLHYYGGDDTWLYHNEALKEYLLLKTDPQHFFLNDIIPEGYKVSPLFTIFNSNGSFIKDLELTLLFKLLAIFDLLSGGRYYINVIFYDAIVFCGSYFLFKAITNKCQSKKTVWLLFIFYYPPLLFWTAGIRKDGLCFAIICGLIFQLYTLLETNFSTKKLVNLILLFVLLFLFRNYTAFVFIPVIIAYTLSIKKKEYSALIFTIVLLVCITIFFLTCFLPDSFNLPLKMAERQHAFAQLSGNSYLQSDALTGNIYSYVKNFFQALNHVFLRPYFTEAKGMLYIFSFCEVAFFFFLFLRTMFKPSLQFKKLVNEPLILSFVMIAILNYIIIGYTVPFLGAIVRYKASFEIFFLLAFLYLQNTTFNFFLLKQKNKGL